MDAKVVDALNKRNIVMTFQSPTTQELFKLLGLNKLINSYCAVPSQTPAFHLLEEAANKKVHDIEALYATYGQSLDLIIGHQEYIKYNCPATQTLCDRSDLYNSLMRLSGHSYTVFVSLCIKMGEKVVNISDKCTVHIKKLKEAEINLYECTRTQGELLLNPYGINGIFETIVEKVEGDVFVLCGVPVFKLYKELKNLLCTPPVGTEKSLYTATKH